MIVTNFLFKFFLRNLFYVVNSKLITSFQILLLTFLFRNKNIREKNYQKVKTIVYRRICNCNIKKLTFIFLPYGCKKTIFEKLGFFKNLNIICFELPIGFLNKDPLVLKNIFIEITRHIEKEYIWAKKNKFKIIKVISCSASNGSGFYTANNYEVDEFYSIVTGATIAQELFSNKYFKMYKQDIINFGNKTALKYESFLKKNKKHLLPFFNCSNLPKITKFYTSRDDIFIEPKFADKIFNKSFKYNQNIKKYSLYLNHQHVILFFFYLYTIKENDLIQKEYKKIGFKKANLIIEENSIKNKYLLKELSKEDKIYLSLYKKYFLDNKKSLFNEKKLIIKFINAVIFNL